MNRAVILQAVGVLPSAGSRSVKGPTITEPDYAAAPPPLNLKVHPAGDCLVWLWRLNADGYGIASFAGPERLAHRQAFTQSRQCRPEHNILHLCHRPFCVQPSHLYDGSAKENSQDRQVRTSQGLNWELFSQKYEVVQRVAKYRWPSPRRANHEALIITPAEHDCEFIVPAMDRLICPTCGRDNLSDDADVYFTGAPQPSAGDPNVANISRRSRSFRNLAGGLTVKTDTTSNYSIPLTRAERRRREKAARKSPLRDKPVLLSSNRVAIQPGQVTSLDVSMKGVPIAGPGMIILTATPLVPRNNALLPTTDNPVTGG